MADDLESYLKALPDRVKERVAQSLLEQAARLSLAQRQTLQSQEKSEPTGHLAQSCTVVPGRNELEVVVVAGGPLTTKRSSNGTEYDHALAEEFGTSKEPARPFFYNTFHLMKREIIDNLKNDIGDELK
jgi:HK97 gp10 family phage protein